MPGLRPLLVSAAALLLAAGCKKAPAPARGPADDGAPARVGRDAPAGPRLPAPYDLPKEPDAGAFLGRPEDLIASLGAYVPQAPAPAAVAELVLGTQAPAELAETLAPQIAVDRPWAAVHVAGEDIVLLPLAREHSAAAALKGLPPRGDTGAVELPPPALTPGAAAPAERLAWVNEATRSLVFAATERGLATSRELVRTYGARPVWGTLAAARAAAALPEFPYARVTAAGAGLHELDLDVLAAAGRPLPVPKDIAPGALTGMLAAADIAVGASTRWPGAKQAVADAIRQMRAGVDRAGFAAKMMLDPMVDQAARVLRRWNGRVLLAVGPARHVRLGLGADEVAAAHRDLGGLLRTVLDNLQLARMFADVPGASLKKVEGGVQVLTVDGLARQIPAAYRAVLDDKGRLRVAFAAGESAGGILVVVGPDPAPVLQAWLTEAAAGAPAKQSEGDLLAGALAVSPAALAPLMSAGTQASALLAALLQLGADRPATRLVVEQRPDRYHVTVRGPELAGRPARQGRE